MVAIDPDRREIADPAQPGCGGDERREPPRQGIALAARRDRDEQPFHVLEDRGWKSDLARDVEGKRRDTILPQCSDACGIARRAADGVSGGAHPAGEDAAGVADPEDEDAHGMKRLMKGCSGIKDVYGAYGG